LAELAQRHRIEASVLHELDAWCLRLTPELVRAVSGDKWPRRLSVLRGGRP
jgi:hypothetical protein